MRFLSYIECMEKLQRLLIISLCLWSGCAYAQPQTILASWYGGGEYLGAHTSSGQRFDPRALTAAHRSFPFGTKLHVTNLSNHRSTVVVINDRGPAAWTGRSLDLSKAAAKELGMLQSGQAKVTIEPMNQ